MNKIPQSFIDDLLNRIDIVEIIDSRVKLKKSGKNFSACCPFHDEKTPSFTVSQDKQFYYCFGCGATGTALSFLIEYERLGFIDAVENLAKTAGVEVPREKTASNKNYESKLKKLYTILERASEYYQAQLKSHPQREKAVHYLKERGLSGHIAKDFGIGYAPTGWDNVLKELGQTKENEKLLVDAGLVIVKEEDSRHYDRFRHRIMYPIKDTRGRIIGFGGRVLGDDKPKYLNSPETDAFHKGRELYGLYEARQANRQLDNIIVVEGYMDVIALAQYEITNAVATLGTACGEDHLQLAFRYSNEIIFCFDGDNAGRKAAKRGLLNALSSMQDGRQIKFLFLAEGQDPDTLVRQIGKERFLEHTKNAQPLEEFLFDVAAENLDVSTMEGRARFSKIAAPLINLLPEGVFRELMFGSLASRTGLSAEVLRELTKEPVKIDTEISSPTREDQRPATTEKPKTQAPQPNLSSRSTANHNNQSYPQARHKDSVEETPYNDNPLESFDYPDYQDSQTEPDQNNGLDEYYSNTPSYEELNLSSGEYDADTPDGSKPDANNIDAFNIDAFNPHTRHSQEPPKSQTLYSPKATSSININPERTATTLLLREPQLLKQIHDIPTCLQSLESAEDNSTPQQTSPNAAPKDKETSVLRELIQYLQKRPEATFHQILGYWGGAKGLEEQKSLTDLVANNNLKSIRHIENYDALKELEQSLKAISLKTTRIDTKQELHRMQQKGLSNLNDEEKNRYRELVSQNKS